MIIRFFSFFFPAPSPYLVAQARTYNLYIQITALIANGVLIRVIPACDKLVSYYSAPGLETLGQLVLDMCGGQQTDLVQSFFTLYDAAIVD